MAENKEYVKVLSNMTADLDSRCADAHKIISCLSSGSAKNNAEAMNEYIRAIVTGYNIIKKNYIKLCEEEGYEPWWIDEMK